MRMRILGLGVGVAAALLLISLVVVGRNAQRSSTGADSLRPAYNGNIPAYNGNIGDLIGISAQEDARITPGYPSFQATPQDQDSGRVKLTWKETADEGVVRYRLYRASDGETFERIAEVPATAENDSLRDWFDTLPSRGSYQYRISAVRVDGAEGDASPLLEVVWD